MTKEDIEKFIDTKLTTEESFVKINFKKRVAVYGQFVKDKDYAHLKSRNFWRIVTGTSLPEYTKSKNIGLARMFSGSEFSKLTATNKMGE
ncbi:MAG: short-chain dehydrogenase [Flavitalea sp.]